MSPFTATTPFIDRHVGPSPDDIKEMAPVIGCDTPDQLVQRAVPHAIRRAPIPPFPPLSEPEIHRTLAEWAQQNRVTTSYLGMGFYPCHTPAVIQRHCFETPSWYTAYTPYQAEISQGRLETLFHFQTIVTELTQLPVANASLLDDATATAEAMTLLYRTRSNTSQHVFLIPTRLFPHVRAVLAVRAAPLGIELQDYDPQALPSLDHAFGALIQTPDGWGEWSDPSPLAAAFIHAGVRVVAYVDPLALTLLPAPGEWGASIAVGSAQRLGIPLGYGGPSAAFFATTQEWVRQLPGRIIGCSKDRLGQPAYRMALQTREQHIRREKATSNICTAQALLAMMATFYCVYHGPDGLTRMARRIHELAMAVATHGVSVGLTLKTAQFFDTVAFETTPQRVNEIMARAEKEGILIRRIQDDTIGLSMDETTTPDALSVVYRVLGDSIAPSPNTTGPTPITAGRHTPFLMQPVFHIYRTETELMRYMHRLASADLALNTAMIPLGSCTMKLNPAATLIPLAWPGVAQLHPFAPLSHSKGYQAIFDDLSTHLMRITELDGVSLQPNAGSQGEYAGLMVIRAYQHAIGQGHRRVALIPASAHGTNPASAAMAGMDIVVVACDASGDIDPDDLKKKVAIHRDTLSVLMVTYPSTHGVFDPSIQDCCRLIHEAGGQVYMDGANMNAQVGLTSPGTLGADVCHINLHKTFAIPHGGGGPGMGPIMVRAHLVPYLPGHPHLDADPLRSPTPHMGPVSAAPWGSASILLVSYAYIRLLGSDGLTQATRMALWNANYMKARLSDAYEVLYTGEGGWVAHEFILNMAPFKKTAGIDVDDIAKRLMDYGFHAPTVSFPVPGTLMIEPTESESKAELDRFCDALLSIRDEIRRIETGEWSQTDNPLKNAPHPLIECTADTWHHPYSRQLAALPTPRSPQKYWPTVARVDGAFGDRNLVCACAPVSEWATRT
ncbi:glycine dehydrogenase (aminomethyl-transferring) [bacterium]|nr:glycine dehydrogenase (aminomethyl-transferring) [bacterium]